MELCNFVVFQKMDPKSYTSYYVRVVYILFLFLQDG